MKPEIKKYTPEDILRSAEGKQQVLVPEYLWQNLSAKLPAFPVYVNRRKIWLAAASIAILFLVNIFALKNNSKLSDTNNPEVQALMQEYGMGSNDDFTIQY